MKPVKIIYILILVACACRKENAITASPASGNPQHGEKKEDFSRFPFYSDIRKFEVADSISYPPRDAIEFAGSSSIRLWHNLPDYFPGYTTIQRGFGGSGLQDLYNFADDIIIPYHPKQLIIYSGDNDVAEGKLNASQIFDLFRHLFNKLREGLPDANIVYISIKPSPARKKFMPLSVATNNKIKSFLASQPNTRYVDVYWKMLDSKGNPKAGIFLADGIHMNEKGYRIWRDAITPVLMK